MKANEDKCHLLVSARCHKTINVCGAEIKSSDLEKLLNMRIESMLNFEEHFTALSTVTPDISLSKKIIRIHFSCNNLVTAHLS